MKTKLRVVNVAFERFMQQVVHTRPVALFAEAFPCVLEAEVFAAALRASMPAGHIIELKTRRDRLDAAEFFVVTLYRLEQV